MLALQRAALVGKQRYKEPPWLGNKDTKSRPGWETKIQRATLVGKQRYKEPPWLGNKERFNLHQVQLKHFWLKHILLYLVPKAVSWSLSVMGTTWRQAHLNAANIIIYCNTTVLPNVSTTVLGMSCGAKYTHHTFMPIIKHHWITANIKHLGKKRKR